MVHSSLYTSTMAQVPSSCTFSFKAPLTATPSSSSSHIKQRRVSLALPSAPRIVQAWTFRDDTGIHSHVPETDSTHQLMPEKRGKMRKIAVSDETDIDPLEKEKRQRKKWSTEETKMLVVGCNRVCSLSFLMDLSFLLLSIAWSRQLEGYPQ